MHEPKYQLVLSGRLREGVELGQAAAALARLFRMPEQEAATLLTGRRSRIRRPLGRDLAERLCGKIQARGAQCRVEPVAQIPRREQPDDGDADDTMLIEVLVDDASPDESSLANRHGERSEGG